MTLLRLLESVHGHLGILAAAALLHPAILLRHGRPLSRGGRWSIVLTTLTVTLAFATGLIIYGDYREHVKPDLFAARPDVGMLFETKEHLAWVVISFAVGAGLAALVAPRTSVQTRRAAGWLYVAAVLLCLATASAGTWVAAVRGFPM